MPKWTGPWPWWLTFPIFIVLGLAWYAMFALPLIWAPLIIVPVGVLAVALVGSFKANLRGRKK